MNITLRNTERNYSLKQITREYSIKNTKKNYSVKSRGLRGLPGTDGDKHFSKSFNAQSEIVCNHNLGKHPSVTIVDSAGDEVEGSVKTNSINSLTVSFEYAHSGMIYLN